MQPIYDIVGGIDAGECDALVRFPYPKEVDTFKERLLPFAQNYDATVKACTSLPAAERDAWDAFYKVFTAFATRKTDTFGAYGEWVATCGYSRYLDAWAEKLRRHCTLVGPDKVSGGSASEVAKYVAIGAVAIGVLGLGVMFAPEIKAIFRR